MSDDVRSAAYRHLWDAIQRFPTSLDMTHESVYRSFQILGQVKAMLARGDSIETVQEFIAWAEQRPVEVTREGGTS